MNTPDIHSRISELLSSFDPGSVLLRSWNLEGGISSKMTAFEIERPDGQRIKRIAREANRYTVANDPYPALREFQTIQGVQKAGIPCSDPIFLEPKLDPDHHALYVIDYIEGSPNLNPVHRSSFLKTYADSLAQIHNIDLSAGDWGFLPRQAISREPRQGPCNDNLRESEIVAAMNRQNPIEIKNWVFRHGDFWPGNLVWQHERLVGIIDWEEACIGDPLADLAICRLDLMWILDFEASCEFTKRYQLLTHLDLTDLPYWDLWASLRPIRNLGDWAESYPQLGRPDITEASMAKKHQEFVGQALLLMGL